MKVGLGLSSNPEDARATHDEINANFDVLNGKLLEVMEWRPFSGTASGAGNITFTHDLGTVPQIVICMFDTAGITWSVSKDLRLSWSESSASITVSGATNVTGFVGRYEHSSQQPRGVTEQALYAMRSAPLTF